MPDDPREILKAAGVECGEVEAWAEQVLTGEFSAMQTVPEALSIIGPLREVVVTSNVAIIALARLVAKYKWQRDECADELGRKLAVGYEYEVTKPFAAQDVIVDLNRRWEEHESKP